MVLIGCEIIFPLVELLVKQGKIKSRNQFIAEAISNELTAREKTDIDAAFSEMATDREYQAEALQIEAEFATARASIQYL